MSLGQTVDRFANEVAANVSLPVPRLPKIGVANSEIGGQIDYALGGAYGFC